jgi:hypothetical protein
MCAARPPVFMNVPTTIDAKPFVLPSALNASTRSVTAGSASTKPRRTPGATIFEKVPSRITRPSRSSAWSVGSGSPSNRRSRYASSSMMGTPWRAAMSSNARRRSSVIDVPAGLLNVGIV